MLQLYLQTFWKLWGLTGFVSRLQDKLFYSCPTN
jgi:hypothetical protein